MLGWKIKKIDFNGLKHRGGIRECTVNLNLFKHMRVRKEFLADDHLVDLEALEDLVDLEALEDLVDLEALEDHLDLEALEDHLDLEALEDHLDLEALEDHLDLEALEDRLDLEAIWKTIWFWCSIFRRVIIGQCIGLWLPGIWLWLWLPGIRL